MLGRRKGTVEAALAEVYRAHDDVAAAARIQNRGGGRSRVQTFKPGAHTGIFDSVS